MVSATHFREIPVEIQTVDDTRELLMRVRRVLNAGEDTPLAGAVDWHRSLVKNQHLYTQGDLSGDVYIILSGSLKAVRVSHQGQEGVIRFYFPNEVLLTDGFQSGVRTMSVIALEKTSVCSMTFAQLRRLMTIDEGVNARCYNILSRRIAEEKAFITMLARANAVQRLAFFLHALRKYHATGADSNKLRLSMSRADIANNLGLSVETVSRSFSALQAASIVHVEARDLVILDDAELNRLAFGGQLPRRPPVMIKPRRNSGAAFA